MASAFFFSNNALVTAAHVVESFNIVGLKLNGYSDVLGAKVTFIKPEYDIAFLEVTADRKHVPITKPARLSELSGNYIFGIERLYEVKAYWINHLKYPPKLDKGLFLKNYSSNLRSRLSDLSKEFSIHPKMLDAELETCERSRVTSGNMLISDNPQLILLTFTFDNEKLRLRVELRGENKYSEVIKVPEFIAIIGKSFIRSFIF